MKNEQLVEKIDSFIVELKNLKGRISMSLKVLNEDASDSIEEFENIIESYNLMPAGIKCPCCNGTGRK